jgi:ribosome-interacting GTPase 1
MEKVLERYFDLKKPVVFVANKIDEIKSKSSEYLKISTHTGEGIEELKEKILKELNLIRVYTKKPGKKRLPVALRTVGRRPFVTLNFSSLRVN